MDIYGDLILDETTTDNFQLTSLLSENNDFNGFYITDFVGEDIDAGDILYYDRLLKCWKKSLANSISTLPAKGLALFSSTSNSNVDILLCGSYRNDSWNFSSSYPGLFLSHLYPGKITTVAPTSIGSYNQQIGLIQNNNQIYVNFYMVWLYNWSQ